MNREEFIKNCSGLGILIDNDLFSKFEHYFKLLLTWNSKFNMTSILEDKDVFLLHFYDSLCLKKVFPKDLNISLCDFGTGAGFPGLVIALVFSSINVTLVESNQKKCIFLNTVIKELGLNNVIVVNDRIENFASKNREKFDIVTCRAVTSIPMILELSVSSVNVNGLLAPLKSLCKDEIVKYKYLEKELGLELVKMEEYNLPINNAYRTIPVYKKNKITDSKYPRNYSSLVKKYKNK